MRFTLSMALLGMVCTGCTSINTLPSSVREANIDDTLGGKTGWSRHQASDFFRGVDKGTVLRAARQGLNSAGFVVKKDDPEGGYVIGEHGMTMYDWNVVSGVYIQEAEDGCKVKVIAQGSKDVGFAGDATDCDWPQAILQGMRQQLRTTESSSDTTPAAAEGVSYGTGFAVSPSGHIVTAFHVVDGNGLAQVKFPDGEWQDAKLLSHSSVCDIAVLKIDSSTPDFLNIAREPAIEIGDTVFTIGYPVASLLGSDPKYSHGAVSSLTGLRGDASLMQVSVPVQPGNSGGPLVSEDGNVVGVVLSTVAVESFYRVTGALPQNVNWAIRSSIVHPLVSEYVGSVKPGVVTREKLIASVSKATCLVRARR